MNFHPDHITVNESEPSAVSSYKVYMRKPDNTLITTALFTANGQHSQDLPIGSTTNFFSVSQTGDFVKLSVQEIGPGGDAGPEVPGFDSSGHSQFQVFPIPNGPQTVLVVP